MDFKIHSPYKPTGDQPQAIKEITESLNSGSEAVTLLGVTGSGKTFTMANVIEKLNRPALILSHNKTLAAQLYGLDILAESIETYKQNFTRFLIFDDALEVDTTKVNKASMCFTRWDMMPLVFLQSSMLSRQDSIRL